MISHGLERPIRRQESRGVRISSVGLPHKRAPPLDAEEEPDVLTDVAEDSSCDEQQQQDAARESESINASSDDEEEDSAAFNEEDPSMEMERPVQRSSLTWRRARESPLTLRHWTGNRELTRPTRPTQRRAHIRLQRDIAALERRREELLALHLNRLLNTGRRDYVVNIASDYYSTFRVGYVRPRLADIQRYCRVAFEDECFSYGPHSDAMDIWVEQWQRYTQLFPALEMQFDSAECIDLQNERGAFECRQPSETTCLVSARGTMSGRISRQAVATIMPHILDNQALVLQLIDRRMDCPITLHFYFNAGGRVARIEFEADFLNALMRLDGISLLEVIHIMEHAEIAENSCVPAVRDFDEYALAALALNDS
ncbi:hypothetical protein PINS_up013038 [Pythium insidiosum]|nr:hypothetical protein PINS_up013038 [Pythium insidiosum]